MTLQVFDFYVVEPYGYPPQSDTKVSAGNDVTITRPDAGPYGTYRVTFDVHLPGPGIATGATKTITDWVTFVRAVQGAYGPFLWKDRLVAPFYRVEKTDADGAIGTGDGSTDTFALAHRDIDASTVKVYVNGVEQIGNWSLTGNNPDPDGAAPLIDFTSAPANTHPVTVEYDYYQRVRFDVDPGLGEWRRANLEFRTSVALVEFWEGAHRA